MSQKDETTKYIKILDDYTTKYTKNKKDFGSKFGFGRNKGNLEKVAVKSTHFQRRRASFTMETITFETGLYCDILPT